MACGSGWSWAASGCACNCCQSYSWVQCCSFCSCCVLRGECWQVWWLSRNLAWKSSKLTPFLPLPYLFCSLNLGLWCKAWNWLARKNTSPFPHLQPIVKWSCSWSWCNVKVWHQIKPINQQEKHCEREREREGNGGKVRGNWVTRARNTFAAQQQLPKCRHLWQPRQDLWAEGGVRTGCGRQIA